jgi:hypothetical protein
MCGCGRSLGLNVAPSFAVNNIFTPPQPHHQHHQYQDYIPQVMDESTQKLIDALRNSPINPPKPKA